MQAVLTADRSQATRVSVAHWLTGSARQRAPQCSNCTAPAYPKRQRESALRESLPTAAPRLSRLSPLSCGAMEAYEVGKRIGRGNYGSVYVARDKRNQRWYCLKMILMEAHSDEERGAREE